jgi:hypothetical protein
LTVSLPAAGPAALIALLIVLLATPVESQNPPAGQATSWAAVDHAMGRRGVIQPGDVQRYSFPRADLRVTAGGVTVKPALALGSWVAFKQMGGTPGKTMAMGDLVLLQSEVPPVIDKLRAAGIEQTALHNHLQHESPPIIYLHIQATGDPVQIAQGVHAALALTQTPAAPPAPPPVGAKFALDTAALASTLGQPGKVNGGVYQVSVPRAEPVRVAGMEIPPAMGVATALNFQPTGDGKAAITGDFALTADEVNPVIAALRDGGVQVTALHSHMLNEDPRLFFMHFWANDDAMKLARTLRTALSRMKVKAPGA